MTGKDLAELFVCIMAVWGVYCILRALLAACAHREHFSVGIHTDPADEAGDIYCQLKTAEFLTEKKNGFGCPPVLLTEVPLGDAYLRELESHGIAVYCKYRKG